MSNPLSPLSPSYQNARARSPKTGSSPFLTKTLDESAADHIPQSPLKNAWTEHETQSLSTHDSNENYPRTEQENDFNDDFEPQSSPFRYEAREETVDFHKLQEYQKDRRWESPVPAVPSHQFDVPEEEGPMSSPFRPDARDETVGFQRLRALQPMSPILNKRLDAQDPESSPFRPQAKDETVDLERLRELQAESPPYDAEPGYHYDEQAESPQYEGQPEYPRYHEQPESPSYNEQPESPRYYEQPMQPESSPFRYEQREETVNFHKSGETQRESNEEAKSPSPPVAHSSPFRQSTKDTDDLQELRESQRRSFGRAKQSSPAIVQNSPFRQSVKESTIDVQKRRSIVRTSLGVDERQSTAATPRKRSFDQTPQDHDEQTNDRCKKGMVSRADPEIHVDYEEESSVIHNQSYVSNTSLTQERSAIGNSVMEDKRNEGMSTVLHEDDDGIPAKKATLTDNELSVLGEDDHDHDFMDDTGLSNFSVLPDMTSFANLRADSPLKSMRGSVGPGSAARTDMYRRSVDPGTPGTARRPYRPSAMYDVDSPIGSPTPRRRASRDIGLSRETSNLLDLTDNMNFYPRQSMQSNARYSPRRSPMRNTRQSMRSPSKMSLLDFDIPPAPTPRSIPTVTPRELESLKSAFMSEISSLRATLSGKEAEVASLKTAVGDAERRVGEAWEEVRHEIARKEELEVEQEEWGRRGKEMETVLLSVRSELEDGERERDRLSQKVDETEKSKEQLEGRIVELETQLSAARSTTESSTVSGSRQTSQSTEDTAREVQDAVEKVARELHTLYKSKHETKVAALKKSYESRWEKRLREAERKLATAHDENDRLREERDAAQSDNMAAANASMISRENDEHEAEKRVLEAQIKGLQHEMASIKDDSERLRFELKSERAEKGELVAAVDEWLAIQNQPAQQPLAQEKRELSVSSTGPAEDEYQSSSEVPAENLRRSVSRSGSSGIRPPASGKKRIPQFGAGGGHSRGNSGGRSGIALPAPGRGGIMSSIERMGRGGA
ncbi:uncharacterized protein N7443_000726 [Penicillium atrosanguineum]|uniref:Uncharacterized protein n=1 Tax=Penicillium atrosanguineum TaxID=1132637 RepID=A0A9W9QF45_9EURO|nr:uncharacterized protein N7443_000726 [Penicillium atrosanguineum]KAJ5313842.1 hypothetical protein N7443_000726 [Penicillium atrosanguineum]KAJ5331013.1 hypothetical protein N7476_000796 [Penicillium atrosanguineum]